jgi:negative regulator of flagellin synthesis FlgM
MKVPGENLVASKISGVEPKPLRVAAGSPVRAARDAATGAGSDTPAADADVHLTGAARGLAAIEQSLRAMPAVDELRVSAVRQRLDEGSYTIDPHRVADRLLRMESELARLDPLDRSPLK